jgi:hypothetical protein
MARDNEESAVVQPIDGKRKIKRSVNGHLMLSVKIDGDNLTNAAVRKPETILVSTRRFAHLKTS